MYPHDKRYTTRFVIDMCERRTRCFFFFSPSIIRVSFFFFFGVYNNTPQQPLCVSTARTVVQRRNRVINRHGSSSSWSLFATVGIRFNGTRDTRTRLCFFLFLSRRRSRVQIPTAVRRRRGRHCNRPPTTRHRYTIIRTLSLINWPLRIIWRAITSLVVTRTNTYTYVQERRLFVTQCEFSCCGISRDRRSYATNYRSSVLNNPLYLECTLRHWWSIA